MKDKPNKLDDAIRERMANLGSPYRPENWDRLSERLDAGEASVDPLDDIVRDKMTGLTTPYRAETWDWMNERLDAEESTVDPLDEVIRSKMADLAVPYLADTWDVMNDRLDGLEEGSPAGAEQGMDEAIYDRMHRLEKPYDPNHWPMLLKKLEANAYVGERVIRYKAMEVSLLLLLLITFIRLPLTTDNRQPAVSPQPLRPQAERAVDDSSEALLADSGIADELSAIKSERPTINTTTEANNASTEVPAGSISGATASGRNTNSELIAKTDEPADRNRPQAISDLYRLPLPRRELAVPNQKIPADIITSDKSFNMEPHPVLGINASPMLGLLAYLPTGMSHPLCLTCTAKLDKEARMAKQPTFLRIGMQGGPDYNRVITPSTLIRGENHEADRYSLGYSGGLTIGLEKGRWEIETGLIYSNKRYYALPVLVLDYSVEEGFVGDGTKQFDLDVFQIPLNFRYNFFRKNRWRAYGMAGMSLHVTTQSNYYLAEANGFASESFQPQPTRPGPDNSGRNAPSIKSEFDNFTKGWLEGGEFSKNSYLTGNIGIGAEYFLTDFWSIYAQPTYSHSLIYLNNGLGPYYDRIHTNSVIFGFKVRLK